MARDPDVELYIKRALDQITAQHEERIPHVLGLLGLILPRAAHWQARGCQCFGRLGDCFCFLFAEKPVFWSGQDGAREVEAPLSNRSQAEEGNFKLKTF